MASLILVRHGNTFEAGETPTWVGARTDMKLTAKGEEQAHAMAETVASTYAPVSAIVAGPLLRTRRSAEIIAAKINQVFTVDERLCEIDYGLWENISTEETIARFGKEIVEKWEKEGAWPEDMNWAPSLDKLLHNIQAFLDEQHKKLLMPNAHHRVAVTSNGILRFVYRKLTGQAPDSAAKVKTGNYCVLEPTDAGWVIKQWNQKPGQ